MTGSSLHSRALWTLVRDQHGVVTRGQLLDAGLTRHAIAHRLARGRLHRVHREVYAVGRPELTWYGRWMAAALACGPGAAVSHRDAAALWRVLARADGPIHLSTPRRMPRQRPGLVVHRRPGFAMDAVHGIPVTTITQTLIDLAATEPTSRLTRAVTEADKLGLIDTDRLRIGLEDHRGRPGVRPLRTLLDRDTYVMTDSVLEDLFVPIAHRAGLSTPVKLRVVGHRVDFFWPDLGLIVECDGLRYHRTPLQQAAGARRDQDHTAAGLTPLRFTHAQVRYEARRVVRVLGSVARRLRGRG